MTSATDRPLSMLLSLAIPGLILAVPAATAEEAGPSARIEEVVVTARKREESLQDVQESVTVLTEEDIENSRVETLRQVVDLTPNVIIRETFRSNETFITMRGISTAQGGLPAASFVVDGVQLGGNEFINQDLFDIERIEVLRGPQGALFGQGAIAGAVNVITKAPTNDLSGSIKATYGNESTMRLAGSVSTALVDDRWYFRLSGYSRSSDGLLDNVRGENIDESDGSSLRARLQFEGERLSMNLRGSSSSASGGAAMQDRPVLGDDGNPVAPDDVANPGPGSNLVGEEDTEFGDLSLRLDYSYDFATLTSITSVADARQDVYGDGDFLPVDIVFQDLAFESDVFNQEVRLVSDADRRSRWLVGLFHQRRDELADVFVQFSVNSPVNPGVTILDQSNATNSESWAYFGQVDYDLTDDVELTLGLRYDQDDQTTGDRNNLDATYAEASFDALQPKVQLSRRWSGARMGYVTYSEGFRSGGFTQSDLFDNEVTRNFEAGFKGTFLTGSLILNAAVFHVDYTNQQLSFVIFDEGRAQRGVLNLEDTNINGLELQLTAKPGANLGFDVGLGYVDSIVTKADTSALEALGIATPVDGNRSPLVPELTLNLGLTYSRSVGNGLALVLHADYRHRGDYYFDPFNQIQTATNGFLDANVRFESDTWSFAVWGRNLGDTRHATNISIGSSNRNRVQNRPRSFGADVAYRF